MITVKLPDGRSINVDTDDPKQASRAAKIWLQNNPKLDEAGAVEAALNIGSTEPPPPPEPEQTPEEMFHGLTEARRGVVEGGLFGSLGFFGGTLEGLVREIAGGEFGTPEAASRVQQTALERASQFASPFSPQTQAGVDILSEVGEATEPLVSAFTGGPEPAIITRLAAQSAPILRAKLGPSADLISPDSGLPSIELQEAMADKGIDLSLFLESPNRLPNLERPRRETLALPAPEGETPPPLAPDETPALPAPIAGSPSQPRLAGREDADRVVNEVIRERIRAGSGNKSLAELQVQNGQIVNDFQGSDAVAQGWRREDVAGMKNANRATKNRLLEMLEIKRRIEGDPTLATDQRPSYVAGDELMQRIRKVRERSTELRNDLDGLAARDGSLRGTKVNPREIQDTFITELDGIGVRVPDEAVESPAALLEFLSDRNAFAGSDISLDKSSQRLIRDMAKLLNDGVVDGDLDATQAHTMKRQIDRTVEFRKTPLVSQSVVGENLAKSLRRSINQSIRRVSNDYARINDELSANMDAMNEIEGALPKRLALFDPRAEEAVGQELRKVLSNYNTRNSLMEGIRKINARAEAAGGVYPVNIMRLVQFDNALDDRFTATARGSFRGEIGSEISRALSNQTTSQMVADPTRELSRKAIEKVVEAVSDFQKITDDNAFNAMQNLLRRDD